MAVDADDRPSRCSARARRAAQEGRVLGRDRVSDGVGDVHRGRARVDGRLDDLGEEIDLGPRGVLGAELDVVDRAALARRRRSPGPLVLAASSSACARGGSPRWPGTRGCAGARRRDAPPRRGRCRPRCTGPGRDHRAGDLGAIARTASKSPGEAIGNPASMMSTPSRASCWATSTFSTMFSGARRLLAVAQGRVEDDDPVGVHGAAPLSV